MVKTRLNPVRQRMQQSIKPIMKAVFGMWIGRENLRLYDTLDWNVANDRHCNAAVPYPDYYTQPAFHGITGGYLTKVAAVTYDPVTAIASPPSESWLRQQLLHAVDDSCQQSPQHILDLGCGTGSTSILLKQAFPRATVVGLDLSPYMLLVAEAKAQRAAVEIDWRHGLAEAAGVDANAFDLATASFLFHEMPPTVTQRVLHEAFRLLRPGGQLLALDGSQAKLRHLGWLIRLFREPYSSVYAAGCVDDWLIAAGFEQVKTDALGWIHQLSTGVKPLSSPEVHQH